MFWENEFLYYVLTSCGILIVAFILSRILRKIFEKTISASSKILKVDVTNYNFLKNAINFIIYIGAVILIFYTIPTLKEIGITLLASAGIFAAIVGFASQAAFANIISGIFVVIFKPFRVGDFIIIQQQSGIIEDITLRHTIIKNFENRRVIIPNSIISNETILNSTIADTKICNHFEFGISYDSNVDKATQIVQEEAIKHPNFIDNRTEEQIINKEQKVMVRMLNWGESSINLRAYIWTKDTADGFVLKCDLFDSVKKRFDKEGIEIPFPHRTIVMKDNK